MNRKRKFNASWSFSLHPLRTDYDAVMTGRTAWTTVDLPHDWLIYDARNLYANGEGWYRKTLTLTPDEQPPGTRFSLRFEGVYMDSTLYVNGHEAGTWKYGYSTFEFDVTPFLRDGDNEIAMRVVYESPNSRWYSGAGIYRSVWLRSYPDTHLAADGIYIAAIPDGGDAWRVETDTEVVLGAGAADGLTLRHCVMNRDGRLVAETETSVPAAEAGASVRVPTALRVDRPSLWDIERPYCYRLITELRLADGTVTARESIRFGFRTLAFDSEKGFFLNSRHVKLYGVCQHHDLGCLGAAVNKVALRRQISLLQEMGVNAIRTAHNMPSAELMELADEMGVLIVSEAFDVWERKKTEFDYARFFPEWWKKDVASWVRRDRNHPSLILWSIGNEIYDTHADERGFMWTKLLRDEVLAHDPKGNARVTIGSNFMPWENAQRCADLLKLAGYNYGEKYYDLHHAQHPDWIIYGSETSSTVQSRGVYHFPLSQSVLADDDEQCSSLGNSSTSWGAKSTESCIIADRDAAYSLGQFLWSGFDYIGEPTPYHTKNSYFGQLDTAGFKKDSYFIYQAEWTDYRVKPMVHLFPYWDFSEGQMIDVRVCSNTPKVELFLNGVSQSVFEIDHARGQKLVGEWRIPYAVGVLRAVAYDEEGRVVAEEVRSSFGDAVALALTPDKTELAADGSDLVFVEISAFDREGRTVDNANNRVSVTVEGPGRLVGLDNGDSTDYDSYKGASRRMFSGKLLAVIAANPEPGRITVRAESKGLQSGEVDLTSAQPPKRSEDGGEEPGSRYAWTADPQAGHEPLGSRADEIPVRKLEILCPQGNRLVADRRSLPVQVRIHPGDATYQEVEWRVTNAAGIDSNIAFLEVDGREAVLTALGDGDVYVRCSTRNGADCVRLYSVMEFHIEGLGQAYLDPYSFVSAGYRNEASRNLTNGNERGVATARDGESRICFENVDFGPVGADEITLPIFSLDGEEFPIEIWEGIPGEENAAMLTRVTYRKPSRWNVYQEETYRLPKRLKGVTSLSFVLRRKIHLKGFQFARVPKAYERLSALEHDQIYGDSFTIAEDAIENIGNNVSLVYRDMDFGETGSSKLVICGRSPLDRNTVHLLFSGPAGETKQMVEFEYSDGYVEREFELERVFGPQTVTLMFLPGSRFDLKAFRFVP
ncbi:MAG: glycoside hydrolase family 2 TIM barrel-domain containing protein [Candidatus Cohnella colombiensis]|uniref:Glycoside hydrolase family 2 TIM barrel-domain containing protein n=1 Tax=Candidatus Cohnella colombiensis TaxID=3121368 RepID=A0AA95EYL4_9BACL|nr:MAG: glycoside hydrolase family 2 TIM barrel-domain containing protein [Cohnella sp.]